MSPKPVSRKRIVLFFVLTFATALLLFCGDYLFRIDETPMEAQLVQSPLGWIIAVLGLLGIALSIPGIHVSAAIFFPSQNFDAHFLAVPIVSQIIWTTVYAVFLLPPPTMLVRAIKQWFKEKPPFCN